MFNSKILNCFLRPARWVKLLPPKGKKQPTGKQDSKYLLNRAPLKGVKRVFFVRNFPDLKIDSILLIFGVFAPFPGV